jgi:hypothetical protein
MIPAMFAHAWAIKKLLLTRATPFEELDWDIRISTL